MSRQINTSGEGSGDEGADARQRVTSLVQEYVEGLNAMRSVSKMGWRNQIPDDRSLLFRKTFVVTSEINKTHLNGLDLLYFLPR